jgi:hypothetical protein
MAEINKPSDINKIWAAAGDVLAPSDSKIATGWQVEIPPRQYFNYIDNKQDQAIAHINQHGIPVWDNTTEYQYSVSGTKSICMGSDGTIYRTKQVSINQNPVTDTTDTYWEIAFANVADFYTQTQSDVRYLQKSANLSDLTNTATARTNLSVYSQAQTYNQSQIDAKTTVASAAQAQAQTSDVVLLSALKLAAAFQGANQSITPAPGFQKVPGGLIVQWGTVAVAGGSTPVSFPVVFPNKCLSVLQGEGSSSGWGTTSPTIHGADAVTVSGFTAKVVRWGGSSWVTGNASAFWIAVGY